MRGTLPRVALCVWRLSRSMFSRLIHAALWVRTLFLLWLSDIPLCGRTCSLHLLSVDGPLGGFPFLALEDAAAMNIHLQVFMCIYVSFLLSVYLVVDLLGHMVSLDLTF